MLILLLIIGSFFIFLYNLYFVSHEDFTIVRKDISMEKILSFAFLLGAFTLFSSRLFYALFNPEPQITNPLGFLAITYFPGLSLSGGILGASVFIYFYTKFKGLPLGKMMDLTTYSFIGVLPVSFLLFFVLNFGRTDIVFNALFIATFIISLAFLKIIYPFCEKGEIKDGSFSLIYLSVFSLVFFLIKLFSFLAAFSFFDLENIVLFILIFASLILLANQEIVDKLLGR